MIYVCLVHVDKLPWYRLRNPMKHTWYVNMKLTADIPDFDSPVHNLIAVINNLNLFINQF